MLPGTPVPRARNHSPVSCADSGHVLEKEQHARTVLVVTDRGIVENGLTAPLEEALRDARVNYAVYDKTQPNPTVDQV